MIARSKEVFIMKNLGMRLEKAIERCGIEKQELARRVGVSKEYISHMTGGKRKITEDFAIKAAPILGVSPEFLLGKTNRPYLSDSDIDFRMQQYVLLPFQEFLDSMIIDITPVLQIGNEIIRYDGKHWLAWSCQLNNDDVKQHILDNSDKTIKYGVTISADDGLTSTYMSYEEFMDWQKTLINQFENLVRQKFPTFTSALPTDFVDDDIYKTIKHSN